MEEDDGVVLFKKMKVLTRSEDNIPLEEEQDEEQRNRRTKRDKRKRKSEGEDVGVKKRRIADFFSESEETDGMEVDGDECSESGMDCENSENFDSAENGDSAEHVDSVECFDTGVKGKQTFECPHCGKFFVSAANVRRHVRIHTGEKPFDCKFCGKKFSDSWDMKKHERIHTGEKPYSCSSCEKSFSCSSNLKQHERRHSEVKPFRCETCGKSFHESSTLKNHELIHTDEKTHFCEHCSKGFSRASSLRRHEKTHSGEKKYTCHTCKKTFITSSNLRRHQKIHTGEKPFKCAHCDKTFNQSGHLKLHERIHTGERPFVCGTCGKRFTRSAALKTHEIIHTGEKPFACTLCNKKFNQSGHLKRHFLKIHKINPGKIPSKPEEFISINSQASISNPKEVTEKPKEKVVPDDTKVMYPAIYGMYPGMQYGYIPYGVPTTTSTASQVSDPVKIETPHDLDSDKSGVKKTSKEIVNQVIPTDNYLATSHPGIQLIQHIPTAIIVPTQPEVTKPSTTAEGKIHSPHPGIQLIQTIPTAYIVPPSIVQRSAPSEKIPENINEPIREKNMLRDILTSNVPVEKPKMNPGITLKLNHSTSNLRMSQGIKLIPIPSKPQLEASTLSAPSFTVSILPSKKTE